MRFGNMSVTIKSHPNVLVKTWRLSLWGLNHLIPMKQLHLDALQLAADLKHPIYDCFYLALARQQRAPLITADKRLFQLGTQQTDLDMRKL